jgi:hypothetical protein
MRSPFQLRPKFHARIRSRAEMKSREIQAATACLRLVETADPNQRRILVDLAGKWLAKARRDEEWARLAAEVTAYQRKAS